MEPYVEEAAALLDVDPWYLQTEWFVSEDKCLEKETCRTILAAEVDAFLDGLRERYAVLGIEQERWPSSRTIEGPTAWAS